MRIVVICPLDICEDECERDDDSSGIHEGLQDREEEEGIFL
jgi:hypothetical protein